MLVCLPVFLISKFGCGRKYMRRLRKSYVKSELSEDKCECCSLWDLFKIFIGYFLCRCCCCKISHGSIKESTEKIKYTTEDWEISINNETISITLDDLNCMKQKYINKQYSHKHHCFKKPGERRNRDQCFHHKTIKWKGLLQHPVLYLLALSFNKMKEKCNPWNVENLKKFNRNSPDFAFKVTPEPTYRRKKDYEPIFFSPEKKITNICLVMKDFPCQYRNTSEDKENLF